VKRLSAGTLITALSLLVVSTPNPANGQLVPQPWVSVGAKDGDVTYSVGARAFNLGVELGSGPDGATGVDVLKFISVPVVSPYVGVGLYSEDGGFAYSGGVQVGASDNVTLGVGYNSVRGVNGQVGIRF
jgi:opacity protein-like surface antigen